MTDSFGIQDSLSELKQLADTAGLLVVDSTYQKYTVFLILSYSSFLYLNAYELKYDWILYMQKLVLLLACIVGV